MDGWMDSLGDNEDWMIVGGRGWGGLEFCMWVWMN